MSKNRKRLFILLVFALFITGMAQLPIFKRYYIADVPGLGWTADFYLTHVLHYLFSGGLLLVFFYLAGKALAGRWLSNISLFGWVKVAIWGGIVVTGLIRVLKNFPQLAFSPEVVMMVDLSHLGFVFLMGMVALAGKLLGLSYLKGADPAPRTDKGAFEMKTA